MKVFDTLNELVEIKRVLAPHLVILIDAALKISAHKDYSLNLREVTLYFLELVCENYSRQLTKTSSGKEIIDRIIEVGFHIASESEEGFENEEDTRKFYEVIFYSLCFG